MLLRFSTALGVGLIFATSPVAENVSCSGGAFTVQNAGHRTDSICNAAQEAAWQLASCNLPVTRPVTIEIADTLPDNCYGLYHCDDELIQLRPLEDYARYLSSRPDGLFGHLRPEVFFNSVLRHELAHAALGSTPCPYEGCPVTREFVAYTMQIRFLSETDRAPFDQMLLEAERTLTPDDLSVIGLMMAREAFIENSHVFLSQQDDPCGLVAGIVRGEVVFDLPVR